MRIAQLAPLMLNVPPEGYGGPERVVSYITEELIRRGHDVTLFATEGSHTQANFVPVCPFPLIDKGPQAVTVFNMLAMEQVFKHENEFDIIHNHIEFFAAPLARRHRIATITTLHEPMHPGKQPLYNEYREFPLVSISDSQRQSYAWLNWQATVYHGLPEALYPFQSQPGQYLAFIGRLTPMKGAIAAIEIALKAGQPIKIAGNIAPNQDAYFAQLKELFNNPLVEYVGELNDQQKRDFLGNASALLFPIDWIEPFGLVMIEAMACGTPVIARRRGSVPEVIQDGVNGFIFDSTEDAVEAVAKLPTLSRTSCRHVFEERFTVTRMVDEYLALYEKMIQERAATLV